MILCFIKCAFYIIFGFFWFLFIFKRNTNNTSIFFEIDDNYVPILFERKEIIFSSFESKDIQLQILLGNYIRRNKEKLNTRFNILLTEEEKRSPLDFKMERSALILYYYFVLAMEYLLKNNSEDYKILNRIFYKEDEIKIFNNFKDTPQYRKIFRGRYLEKIDKNEFVAKCIDDDVIFLKLLPYSSLIFFNTIKNYDSIINNGLLNLAECLLENIRFIDFDSKYLKYSESFLSAQSFLYRREDIYEFLNFSIQKNAHKRFTSFLYTIIYDYNILIIEALRFLKERNEDFKKNRVELIRDKIYSEIINQEEFKTEYIETEKITKMDRKITLKIGIIKRFDIAHFNHALGILYFNKKNKISFKEYELDELKNILDNISSLIFQFFKEGKKHFEDINYKIKILLFAPIGNNDESKFSKIIPEKNEKTSKNEVMKTKEEIGIVENSNQIKKVSNLDDVEISEVNNKSVTSKIKDENRKELEKSAGRDKETPFHDKSISLLLNNENRPTKSIRENSIGRNFGMLPKNNLHYKIAKNQTYSNKNLKKKYLVSKKNSNTAVKLCYIINRTLFTNTLLNSIPEEE